MKGSTDIYSAEPARGWLPWGALAPFLALVFVVATALIGDNFIAGFVNLDPMGNPQDALSLIAFTLVPFGLLLLVLLAWVRFVERRSWASIGIAGDRPLRQFLKGHAVGALSITAIVLVIWAVGGVELVGVAPVFSQPKYLLPIVALLFTFALQSSVEELVFRGWLLSVLARKFNVPIAVVVSSAVFSLLHFSRHQHWMVTSATFLFAFFCCAW